MPITSGELAKRLQVTLHGSASIELTHVSPLHRAGEGSLSFVNHVRYLPELATSKAAAVIVKPEWINYCHGVSVISENPYLSYAQAANILHPRQNTYNGHHPSAEIDKRAELGNHVNIGPKSVIAEGVELGDNVVIGPGCYIGSNTIIGAGTVLAANVVVEHGCRIGVDCLIQSGAVIGSDGFGYARDTNSWVHIPQIGSVVIGDRVEIGANTTIDRGAMDDTIIEDGVILDNQIQVAHNVVIGENAAVAGCVGIAGSARIGKRCTIGGASTILGHLELVDDVHINAMSLVATSVDTPGRYASSMPVDEDIKWRKNYVRFRRLDEMARRLQRVEKKLATHEDKSKN